MVGGSAGALLALQRQAGNRAALAALGGVQRKVAKYAGTEVDTGPIADIENSALSAGMKATADEALANVTAGTAKEAQPWAAERTKNNGGKVPGSVKNFKWGVTHHNRDGHLPGKKGAGGYKEYYIRSSTDLAAGASENERLCISDSTGDVFHTATHYGDKPGAAFTHFT
jgi:guanyl-specific ribonuclease Sa